MNESRFFVIIMLVEGLPLVCVECFFFGYLDDQNIQTFIYSVLHVACL